jgi:hypothetical protein
MKLLVDTDAFCKLGIAGLVKEAAQIFSAELQECGRLPALTYMLRRGSLRRLYGAEACDALIPVADAMPVMPQPSLTWLDKLTPLDEIDPGEAQIFATAAETGLIVISNDKRALRALKDVDGFPDALTGRIAILEAVLLVLCQQFGDDDVRRHVARLTASDTVVKVCFSDQNPHPREGLTSYYRAIATEVRPLVLWDPQVGGQT